MFADFLPPSVVDIQDKIAIAVLQQLKRWVVQVPFEQGTTAIATAYVHYSRDRSASRPNATPILLLPGFDSSLLEFRRLLLLLTTQHQTWAVDLFGLGFTEYLPTLAVNPQIIRQHLLSVVKTWIGQLATGFDSTLHKSQWRQRYKFIATLLVCPFCSG
ncbi:MAG TPA: hypothetical protein V6D11_24035 [Waterburya sp.]|jgi:pimeloyl-ACP methyl ester carboxylesterase